jgi:hypothetical protein
MKTPLLLLAFLFIAAPAHAGKITKSGCAGRNPQALVRASNGIGAYVHPYAVDAFKCVLNGFENTTRLRIVWVGGYGCRRNKSNHPRGLAMDINQYARDRTKPVVPRRPGVQIAHDCKNVTSGAVWRNPDNGHFEIRSVSRAEQGYKQKRQRRHVQYYYY